MVVLAEVAIALTVVGWFLAPNIKDLMDSARSYARSEYKWHTGLQEKLEKLLEALEQINSFMGAARAGLVQDNPALIRSLWDLKDAIHDAEELLDKFQYEILEANLTMKKRHPVMRAMDSTVDLGKHVIGSKDSLKELKKLLKRLDKLQQRSKDLLHASQLGVRRNSRPMTGPLPINDEIFGYDKEYANLLSCLCDGDDAGAVVVAIIGHAGAGKTELARKAFHHFENVRREHFNVQIWVCVYGIFRETDLLREIWKSAFGREPVGEMNVASLQLELAEVVRDSRYLLVLDDVWNDESEPSERIRRTKWDTVLSPFKQHGDEGSRILMTTRAEICSEILGAGARVQLNGIHPADAALLLKKTALGDKDAAVPRKLERVFQEHVEEVLHGSPMAAEEVGLMLNGSLDPAMWKKTLRGGHPDEVLRAHLSSYQDLAPVLQHCFAFCSIFPATWRFDPNNLIRMWVALGFVEASSLQGGKTTEEDVARGYFDALVQRSLFEKYAAVEGKSGSAYYVIHKHIHSMLRMVSPNYYVAIDGSRDTTNPIPLTVRHLSVTPSCLDQLKACTADQLKKVRTLLVFKDATSSSSTSPLVTAIDSGVLQKFKGARVLDFSVTQIAELPESIKKLKHLRYLGLPNTMKRLGAYFTKLHLLQTLDVIISKKVRSKDLQIPDEMSSLTNLRHLGLDMSYIAKIHGIGSLQKLEGSVEFHAGKSEEGHGIKELEKLNSLRKKLHIKGLETVSSTQESQSALLDKKENLKVLELEWELRSVGQHEPSDSAVLQGLKPHPNLDKLEIARYFGTTSPVWLANPQVLKNLRSLILKNCRKLQVLPLVGGLPHLELLRVKELCSVERIDSLFCRSGAFSSLEKIVLDDMPQLVAWDAGGSDGIDMPILFPRLKEVKIRDCPKLTLLSGLLCCRLSLTDLHVERCPKVRGTYSWSDFPSLTQQKLNILGCPGLQFVESLAEEAVAPCPTHGRRSPVLAWSFPYILVCLCILYQMGTRYLPLLLSGLEARP